MFWSDFRRAPLNYLFSRGRLIGQLGLLLRTSGRRTREEYSWPELIHFVFEFAGGFLKPLQVPTEIQRALEEVERLKPRFILEIGTATGGSFFLLSRAAAADALLISLDLPGGRWGGGYSNWKTRVFRRLLLPGQSANFVRNNSHDVASREQVREVLGNNRLDLLFIDGDHSYEGVKTDFKLYSDLVRPGGLVILHDIALHAPTSDCHVDQFWAAIRDRYPCQEIIEDPKQGWAGIGILRNQPTNEPVIAKG